MKRRGCEICATGINYHLGIRGPAHPLKIWSRDEDELDTPAAAGDAASADNARPAGGGRRHRVRHVLRNVSCHAAPGEILAIVGPSGAGKSTLLEILAGRLSPQWPPEILVDGLPVDMPAFRRTTGYVTQRDVLFPLLTVRETLAFGARLRVGAASAGELRDRVDTLISELGLTRAADTRVKALSGGERRRVSIGVEVVHDPAVLILDEPTSGLDSASALQVVGALRTMAEVHRRTVILSIHQPGARITKMLSAVLLLAGGTVVHHGTVDSLHSSLVAAGLQLPPHFDVIELAIDSIDALRQHHRLTGAAEVDDTTPVQSKRDRCTLQQLFQLHKVADEETLAAVADTYVLSGGGGGGGGCVGYANSQLTEVAVLARRFFCNVARTRQLFACRTVCMLVAGLALGSIFYNLADDKVAERVGLFAFMLTFLLSSTTEALPIFLQEREILMKETSSGSYRVSSYAVANAVVFLPFLLALAVLFAVPVYWLVGLRHSAGAFGYFLLLTWTTLYTANAVVVCVTAAAPDFIVGNAAIAGVMGSFFLFSGYFIPARSVPGFWVFMHVLSLFKWPFEALLVNEFAGRCVAVEFGACVAQGDELLMREGVDVGCRWRNLAVMAGYAVAYRLLGFVFLTARCRWTQSGGLRRSLIPWT